LNTEDTEDTQRKSTILHTIRAFAERSHERPIPYFLCVSSVSSVLILIARTPSAAFASHD